jgi:hypothetical protein
MDHRSRFSLGLTVALVGLSGCTDVTTPTQSSANQALKLYESAAGMASGDDPHRPDEASYRKLSGQIQGFGGFAYDSLGNVHVFLKGQRDERGIAVVRRALHPLLLEWPTGSRIRRSADPQVFVHRAQFAFDELRSWRDRVSDPLLTLNGVAFVDLDETRNRLTIGLDPMQASAARERGFGHIGPSERTG